MNGMSSCIPAALLIHLVNTHFIVHIFVISLDPQGTQTEDSSTPAYLFSLLKLHLYFIQCILISPI